MFALNASAQLSPFQPEVDVRFKKLEDGSVFSAGQAKKVAKFKISGATTAAGSVATHGTGVFLPKGALITNGYFYIKSAIQSSGTPALSVQCEDSANILAATNPKIRATNELLAAIPTGATATFVKDIGAACEIKYVVGTAALTGGQWNGFVEYVDLSN